MRASQKILVPFLLLVVGILVALAFRHAAVLSGIAGAALVAIAGLCLSTAIGGRARWRDDWLSAALLFLLVTLGILCTDGLLLTLLHVRIDRSSVVWSFGLLSVVGVFALVLATRLESLPSDPDLEARPVNRLVPLGTAVLVIALLSGAIILSVRSQETKDRRDGFIALSGTVTKSDAQLILHLQVKNVNMPRSAFTLVVRSVAADASPAGRELARQAVTLERNSTMQTNVVVRSSTAPLDVVLYNGNEVYRELSLDNSVGVKG